MEYSDILQKVRTAYDKYLDELQQGAEEMSEQPDIEMFDISPDNFSRDQICRWRALAIQDAIINGNALDLLLSDESLEQMMDRSFLLDKLVSNYKHISILINTPEATRPPGVLCILENQLVNNLLACSIADEEDMLDDNLKGSLKDILNNMEEDNDEYC